MSGRPVAQGQHELEWTAPVGFHGFDHQNDIVVDRDGNSYVAGIILPAPDRMRQAYVAKVRSNGTVEWTRQFGGSWDNTEAFNVGVDPSGFVTVAGYAPPDYPATSGDVSGPTTYTQKAFVARFSPDGDQLTAHVFAKLNSNFFITALDVTSNGDAVVGINRTDRTYDARGMMTGERTFVEIVRVKADGSSRSSLGILEGSGHEYVMDLAVNETSGRVYVVGHTSSANFPVTANALDKTYASIDGFVSILKDGALEYSTFIGGSYTDAVQRIDFDAAGNIYLLMEASPYAAFPLPLAGSGGAAVLKFDSNWGFIAGSRYGGWPGDLVVQPDGRVYTTGLGPTSGTTPTSDPFGTAPIQSGPYNSSLTGYAAELDLATGTAKWMSYVTTSGDGPTGDDIRPALALGPDGALHIAHSSYNDRMLFEEPWNEPSFNHYEETVDATFKRNTFVMKVGGAPPAPVGDTLPGTVVTVTEGSTSVTFASVTGAGETTVTPIDPSQLNLTLPAGFRLSEGVQAVEITTTAQFTAPVRVCLDGSALSAAEFDRAEILHGVSGSWVVEPTTRDAATRLICGSASSLSPFAVGIAPDRTAPVITITEPSNTRYLLNAPVTPVFNCSDHESGITACAGDVMDTAVAGAGTFTVRATNGAGLTTTASASFNVGFGVEALFDQTKSHRAGSTVPVRVQLTDAAGANVSSTSVGLTVRGMIRVGSDAPLAVEDAGNANPDAGFRFDTDAYVFNMSTKGMTTGTWELRFTAGADPTVHTVRISIR